MGSLMISFALLFYLSEMWRVMLKTFEGFLPIGAYMPNIIQKPEERVTIEMEFI